MALLYGLLERDFQAAGEDLLANAAWQAMAKIKQVGLETEEGAKKRVVTQGSEQTGRVLKALRLKRGAATTPSGLLAEEEAAVWC